MPFENIKPQPEKEKEEKKEESEEKEEEKKETPPIETGEEGEKIKTEEGQKKETGIEGKKEEEQIKAKEEKEGIKKPEAQPTKKEAIKNPAEIVNHFYEELEKIKDLPCNTEKQKITILKESSKLIKDWLPFGHLDDFQGIDKLMDYMEKQRPKLAFSYSRHQEKLAQQVALEMAFQYPLWKKNEPEKEEEKREKITEFIDKWLKKKSIYYQRAQKYKEFLLGPSEKHNKHQTQSTGEIIEKATKSKKWFASETATLLKLLGQRDKTLSLVSKILALEGVPYKKGIQSISQKIENQNIRRATISQLRKIEEMTEEERTRLLLSEKEKKGILPELPLKKQYFTEYINYLAQKHPHLAETAKILAQELSDKWSSASPSFKEQIKQKLSSLEQKEEKMPSVVKRVAEHIRKSGTGKDVGTLIGYAALVFIILFLVGEIKLGEKITGVGSGIKT